MVDLKAFDPATHRALTGADNSLVLASIVRLARLGRLYEVRLLLVQNGN
jgi:pyruvate-formate lyase-activating enzyme